MRSAPSGAAARPTRNAGPSHARQRVELRATSHTATLQPVISAATQGATRQHGADHHTTINLLLKSYA